jgi:hypothetical protein
VYDRRVERVTGERGELRTHFGLMSSSSATRVAAATLPAPFEAAVEDADEAVAKLA